MDNGPVVQAEEPLARPGNSDAPVTDELNQYKSIIRFRDAILAGAHPEIQLSHRSSSSPSKSRPNSATGLPNGQNPLALNAQAVSSNTAAITSSNPLPPSGPSHKDTGGPRGVPEFVSIFPEKPDEFVMAEIQNQRQRLERALKEDVEKRRYAKNDKGEPLSDLDLSEVLTKALMLVQASAAPPAPADPNLAATNEASSDSFDDNTFYSSRHDTPESRLAARVQNESDEGEEYEPFESEPQT